MVRSERVYRRLLDRLVKRYDVDPPIVVRWDVPLHRGGIPRLDRSCEAELHEISLTGAVMVALAPHRVAAVGDRIEIRSDSGTGQVKVRHVCANPNRTVSFGVEFIDVTNVFTDLDEMVGQLRGGNRQFHQSWEIWR